MAPLKRNKKDATSLLWSLGPAEQHGKAFLASLGAHDITAARALSAEQIQNASTILAFTPVADGQTIVGDPHALFEAGKFNDTPILLGTNSNDGGMFASSTSTPANFEKQVREDCGSAADSILSVYPHATTQEASIAGKDVVRDAIFAWPTWAWGNATIAARQEQSVRL